MIVPTDSIKLKNWSAHLNCYTVNVIAKFFKNIRCIEYGPHLDPNPKFQQSNKNGNRF